jgi:hypothetical protein
LARKQRAEATSRSAERKAQKKAARKAAERQRIEQLRTAKAAEREESNGASAERPRRKQREARPVGEDQPRREERRRAQRRVEEPRDSDPEIEIERVPDKPQRSRSESAISLRTLGAIGLILVFTVAMVWLFHGR